MPVWTPELLHAMRHAGDERADEALRTATAAHGDVARISQVFRSFAADEAELPADAPQELRDFVADTQALPATLDPARAARGAEVMLDHATLVALVLLLKSLPSGYAAPRLATILHFTGNLEQRPYRRALGVLQMLVNLLRPDAFVPGGRALVTGQKLRLLHAGIRRLVRRHVPDHEARFGAPVSQLDMVYTTMTFSVKVIEGLATLGVPLTAQQQDDYFHLWHSYGLLQGIRPEWMPASVDEGRALCRAYDAELADAATNPAGVALTAADLAMMRQLMPAPLRWLGLGSAPQVYLVELLGRADAARVGVAPVHPLLEHLVLRLPRAWQRLWNRALPDHHVHAAWSRRFFSTLIDRAWGGEVRFSVPEHLSDLRRLA
jgi:hypothetical protein